MFQAKKANATVSFSVLPLSLDMFRGTWRSSRWKSRKLGFLRWGSVATEETPRESRTGFGKIGCSCLLSSRKKCVVREEAERKGGKKGVRFFSFAPLVFCFVC